MTFIALTQRTQNIMTLYIGGLTPEITEDDIRDKFYLFGEIRGIRVVQKSNCAFVTYEFLLTCRAWLLTSVHLLDILLAQRPKRQWRRVIKLLISRGRR